MSEELVIRVIFVFLPVLLGIISAKRYSIIHGIIVFITTVFMLEGLSVFLNFASGNAEFFHDLACVFDTGVYYLHQGLYLPFYDTMVYLGFEAAASSGWVYLVVFIFYCICQAFASWRRKKRKAQEKALKKALKNATK